MTSVFDSLGDAGRARPHAPVGQVAAPGTSDDAGSGGLDLSVFVSLGAQIGRLASGMDAERERRASMEPPGDPVAQATGVVNGSEPLVLDLGSVPLGRVWQVRRIISGGPQATDTPAGSVFAFRQGAPPSDLNTSNVVDSWPSFSTGAQGSTYGTHQLFLRASEHLFLVVTGGDDGASWVAAAQIEDWSEATFQSTYAE
jgi:hypothetical protein